MRTLLFLLALLVVPSSALAHATGAQATNGQAATAPATDAPEGTRIAIAGVIGPSGTPETNQKLFDSLSAELRGEIGSLVGTPIVRDKLDAIALRIETEKPDMVAAVSALKIDEPVWVGVQEALAATLAGLRDELDRTRAVRRLRRRAVGAA